MWTLPRSRSPVTGIIKPVAFEKFLEVTRQIEIYWLVLKRPPE
jgi:hypothetical protein